MYTLELKRDKGICFGRIKTRTNIYEATEDKYRFLNTHISRHEVFIACWTQPFANEISDVTQDNKNKVADICGEEDVIWGVLSDMGRDGGALFMLANRSVLFVSTVAKLCMDGGEDLFGCGRA
jgi:hypothetical protein